MTEGQWLPRSENLNRSVLFFKGTRFPDGGLPRNSDGSASALPVSRPAGRSLAPAACLLADSQKEPFLEVLQSQSLPPQTAPSASGWSDKFAGWDSHPLETTHLLRHTETSGLGVC